MTAPNPEAQAEQLATAYWETDDDAVREMLFDAIVGLELIAGRFTSPRVREVLDLPGSGLPPGVADHL